MKNADNKINASNPIPMSVVMPTCPSIWQPDIIGYDDSYFGI
jgi:hypothetical protein